MAWKFSSSCHIDSSFSERNLPIMHTSSKRALGWSSKAHSTLIPGLLWGQRRSSLQHLDSLEGAKHCLIHGMLIMSHHTLSVVYQDASSLRGEYKHCCHLFIHLFLFWPEFEDVYGKGCLFTCSVPSGKSQHISQRPCCGAVVSANVYRPLCTFVLVRNLLFLFFRF